MSFIATIEAELAGVRGRIAALQAEEADLEAALRVFARLSGDHSPDAGKMVSDKSASVPSQGGAHQAGEGGVALAPSSPAANPAANAGEGANGAEAVASVDPASREDDGADRQQPATSGLTGGDPATIGGAGVSPATSHAAGKPAGERSSAAPSLRSRISMLYQEHPDYTHDEAMAALGCTRGSLTGYSSLLGIKWASLPRSGGRPPKKPVEADHEPESPPAVAPAPANDTPRVVRPRSGSKFYLVNDKGEYLNRYAGGFTRDRREAWIGTQDQLVGCRRNFDLARDCAERPVTKELPPAPINREVA